MYFKVRYRTVGYHTRCYLFAGREMVGTYALLGSFICSAEEFEAIKQELKNAPFEDMEVVGRDAAFGIIDTEAEEKSMQMHAALHEKHPEDYEPPE